MNSATFEMSRVFQIRFTCSCEESQLLSFKDICIQFVYVLVLKYSLTSPSSKRSTLVEPAIHAQRILASDQRYVVQAR